MAGKLATVVACLVFAVPFGGVGVFASWAIGATLTDAYRAREWVRVRASVGDATLTSGGDTFRAEGSYRYTFQGKEYTGSRLGISRVGGSDNIDDWHHEVSAKLKDARSAGKPVTVWVNPDNPAESVFDRSVRWGEILFMTPFALAFGGVGVGALIVAVAVLRGPKAGASVNAVVSADKSGNATPGFLWLFAFFWNALSFPIAILVISDVIESGEWAGLLVLLFPLVGVGLLWAAISTTWSAWRARRGAIKPTTPSRRPASVPGKLSAQAARAMFDPQAASAARFALRPAPVGEIDIPPAIAELEERGATLVVRYSARRRLGLAIGLLLAGSLIALIGGVVFFSDNSLIGAVIMVVLGGLLDVGAVALFLGNLVVTVESGKLNVEESGMFGRKSWNAARDSIRAIRPVLSYTVNGLPYFSLFAEAGTERIPLGNSLKGEEIADAVARRICRALGASPSIIAPASNMAPHPTTD